ncbi:MAG TPA: hypothetical protein VHO07_29810, partial [Streptosporangiaceae bacterium]|nr:hypothetical protein [Streptosporangiaceae bacterium]
VADGRTIGEIAGLPGDAWVSFVVRDGQLVPIKEDIRLRPGDDVLVLADPELREELITAFEGGSSGGVSGPASTAGERLPRPASAAGRSTTAASTSAAAARPKFPLRNGPGGFQHARDQRNRA